MSAALAIQRVHRDRGWSRNDIAREFLKRYRFPQHEKKRDARSFAAEIRRLEAGNATWFAKRPDAAKVIAEILECSQAELGITTDDAQISWPDFPEMRALDLTKEDPFDISEWASVLNAATISGAWVVAASGTGKSLFARWAESRGLATCVVASTLASAETEIVQALQRTAGARPVLVDLMDARGGLDVSQRLARLRVVVLASDPPPPTDREETAWTLFAPDRLERDRFVDWIANRLDDGPDIAPRFRRELVKVDPSGILISTPDAAIQFLGGIYEKRAVDTVEALALRAGSRAKSRWLRANGAALFRELLRRRWLDLRHPYGVTVPRAVWESYVPAGLVVPKDPTELRQFIARLKRDRSLDIDVVTAQLTLDSQSVVALLVEAGLLRGIDDQMELRPSWLAHLETVLLVKSALSSAPLESCVGCTDPPRRALLYGVLVALKPRPWQEFVEAALQGGGTRDLGRVAAIECAFASAALRAERGLPTGETTLLNRLWRGQRELLEPRYPMGADEPLTRPGASSGFLGGGAFVADCWTWSLMISKPIDVTASPWEFPAWEVSPDEIPNWMHSVDRDADTVARLTQILPKLVTRWTPTKLSSAPLWMWPSFLTADGDWAFESSALRFLTVDRDATTLVESLARAPEARATSVVRQLLAAILQWEAWAAFDVLRGPLADRLLAAFDPTTAAPALMSWARVAYHDLSRVPDRLRGHIVASALEQGLHLEFDVARFLDSDDADVLVRLSKGPTSSAAIARTWELVPDRAHRELTEHLSDGNDGNGWLEGSPVVIERILRTVEAMPRPLPDGVRRWATRRMIQHPWLATRLVALL